MLLFIIIIIILKLYSYM